MNAATITPQFIVNFHDAHKSVVVEASIANAIKLLWICDNNDAIQFVCDHYDVSPMEARDAITEILHHLEAYKLVSSRRT